MPRTYTLALIAAMSCTAPTRAAQPKVLWATPFNHLRGGERISDLTVDRQGNPIAIGSGQGSGFVCKLSPEGEMLWKIDLGSIHDAGRFGHGAHAVAVDDDGNVYATGETEGIGQIISLFIYKLSAEGEVLKTFRTDKGRWTSCNEIVATKEGFLVGGLAVGGFHSTKARKTTATLLVTVDHDLSFGRNVDTDKSKTKIHGFARHLDSTTKTIQGLAVLTDERVAILGTVKVTGDSHTYLQLRGKNLRRIEWTKRLTWPRMLDVPGSVHVMTDSEAPKVASDARGNLFVAWDRWLVSGTKKNNFVKCCVTMFDSDGEQQWEHITPSEHGTDTTHQIAVGKNGIAYVAADLNERPALLRYTAKPHIAPPFYLFPEALQTGECRGVAVAPDGTVYVAGNVDGISRLDRKMHFDETDSESPVGVISFSRTCFVARIAVTAKQARLAREREE